MDTKIKRKYVNGSERPPWRCIELGVAAEGASFKHISILRVEHLHAWVLCGVGAKQVIKTWLLRSFSVSLRSNHLRYREQSDRLEPKLLSVQSSQCEGRRRSASSRIRKLDSEPRLISSVLLEDNSTSVVSNLFLVLASSDAILSLMSFDWERSKWKRKGSLIHHKSPVLSLTHFHSLLFPSGIISE